MNWQIITDSSCDLKEWDNEIPLDSVPFVIRVDDTDYVDTPDLDVETLVTAMEKSAISRTSCSVISLPPVASPGRVLRCGVLRGLPQRLPCPLTPIVTDQTALPGKVSLSRQASSRAIRIRIASMAVSIAPSVSWTCSLSRPAFARS